jgi:hypothetical protein
MAKAVYRRVVFMNYVRRHPLLAKPVLIPRLSKKGRSWKDNSSAPVDDALHRHPAP